MNLNELLPFACVQVPLIAPDKRMALDTLAALLAAHYGLADPAAVQSAVWQREAARSTGIGFGVAVPHARVPGVAGLHMAFARTAEPIEFGALDKRPVDLLVMLTSPPEQAAMHIQALAQVARLLADEGFRAALRRAPDAAAARLLLVTRRIE